MAFEKIEGSAFVPASRKRNNQWSTCEVGTTYFMKEGIDYKLDGDTSEDRSKLPKLIGVSSNLRNYAKSRGWKVSIKRGSNKDGISGIEFKFTAITQAAQ